MEQSSRLGPPVFFFGGGSIDGVSRVDDRLLGTQVETSAGREGHAHAREGLLTQVDLGEQGIGRAISQLFSSPSELSTAPADSAVRDKVLRAAAHVGTVFNQALSEQRADAVATVDGFLSRLVEAGNSKGSDGSIFAGHQTDQAAFDADDRAGIATAAVRLDTARQQVADAHSRIGGQMDLLLRQDDVLSEQQFRLDARRSAVAEVDGVDAIADLVKAKGTLESAVRVSGQMLNTLTLVGLSRNDFSLAPPESPALTHD